MSEKEVQESQKTVVAFIAGLLVGGLLVWVFAGDTKKAEAPQDEVDNTPTEVTDINVDSTPTDTNTTEKTPKLEVGEGSASVDEQAAGSVVKLNSATFPTDEGWIAVRAYDNGKLGSILGAIMYSQEANLVPTEIPLVYPTTSGREYAIVFFTQDDKRGFNLDGDVQIDVEPTVFTVK